MIIEIREIKCFLLLIRSHFLTKPAIIIIIPNLTLDFKQEIIYRVLLLFNREKKASNRTDDNKSVFLFLS